MAGNENSKSTRRALVTSALALLACAAVLIGITYAWFTDTAQTGTSTIQTGTLDVALEMKVGDTWENVEGKTLEWVSADNNSDFVWEPGCTYTLPELRVVNNGDRALKYKLEITGIDGDDDLLKAIDFTYGDGIALSEEVSLAPEASTEGIVIQGHMKEEAGNEYQGLTLEGIQITVVATQDTVESDSTGNTYDADAQFAIADNASLADKIANAVSGDIIQVGKGSYTLPAVSLAEGVTLTGDGTSTILTATANDAQTGFVVNSKNVTISNMTLKADSAIANDTYKGILDIQEGDTVIDGVDMEVYAYTCPIVVKAGVDAGETVTISNSNLVSGFKAIHIVDSVNGTINIDNCNLDAVYPFNVNSGNSDDLVINVTNSKLHGWTSYSDIKAVNFVNTEFSKGFTGYDFLRAYADTTFENCTFDSYFTLGAGNAGKTIILNNCTKDDVKITADNIESLLFATYESDLECLHGCTIIVDGVTVTFA